MKLAMPSHGKKKTTPLLIPSIRFTKLIIHHLKIKHNIHPRTGSHLHYSHKDNVLGNLKSVGKDGREVFVKLKQASTKPSKEIPEKKQKLVKETHDEPSTAKRSKGGLVGKRCKPKSPLNLVDEFADDGGKGKEKIIDEQLAHTLLDLNTLKKKSTTDQYILQKRTPESAEPTIPSLQPKDEGITITNSELECDEIVTPVNKKKDASNKEITKINAGVQDEGQARSNPGKQDKGQAGLNPGNVVEFQSQPSHVVHAGLNLEPMDLAEEEPKKTNAELEVQSMVTILIHQDTSLVPPMTTMIIDLITSQSDSLTIHTLLPTSTATTTTTTTLSPPPP
nr:hypothetical protein [Tanacetum cinerariifolium]